MAAWSADQKGVARGMGLAMLATLGGLALPWLIDGLPRAPEPLAERLAWWLTLDAWLGIWLLVAIGRIAGHRFATPADIHGGARGQGTERVQILQALLQNTLEQTVLAFLAHGAFLAVAPTRWGATVVLFVAYFGIGRALFFRGYASGAPARAFGFALTFYPSVALLLTSLLLGLGRATGS
ncbi:MAG: MAPEG family protein [Polyangiaceae bacterium]